MKASVYSSPEVKEIPLAERILVRGVTKTADVISMPVLWLANKLSGVSVPDLIIKVVSVFWTEIRRGALGTGIQSALGNFIGPNASFYIGKVRLQWSSATPTFQECSDSIMWPESPKGGRCPFQGSADLLL